MMAGVGFAAAEREEAAQALRESEDRFRLLEDELRQAHKMEAVGQLAGGIAHDFNNLLSVIGGYTEILLLRLGAEGDGSKELTEIHKATERATRLTRQLLAYSRKQLLEPRVLDLNAVVAETRTMLEPLIGENIELAATLARDLGSISADNGQIEQIIMNLVVNARDAMSDGGKLTLETRNVTFGVGSPSGPAGTTPGDYVVFIVSDTGQGMDAATAEQIFEPFYTTKERSAGTGLGLATVYGIVKQSGGFIEVESEPGVGSTFRIYFPRVAAEPEPLRPKSVEERSLTGSETVLLVEDDEALRRLGGVILEQYGYTVLPAGDGAAAMELAGAHPDPIELLMTDILMPGMGGIELAAQALEAASAARGSLHLRLQRQWKQPRGNPGIAISAEAVRDGRPRPHVARTARLTSVITTQSSTGGCRRRAVRAALA